jgi:hypothetical protein
VLRPSDCREQRGDLCHTGGLHAEARTHLLAQLTDLPIQSVDILAQLVDLLALFQLDLAQTAHFELKLGEARFKIVV